MSAKTGQQDAVCRPDQPWGILRAAHGMAAHKEGKQVNKGMMAAIAGLILTAAALTPAGATQRTGINTGGTSFFDGFGGSQPGCAFIAYLGHVDFDQLNGADGNKVADFELQSTYVIPQVACTTEQELFGGLLGWNVIVPFSGQDASPNPPLSTNGFGLGDALVGVSLAFPPVIENGRPVFAHGFEVDVIAPTGKFDPTKAINPGNDYWSINPFWKATWLPAPGWEVSWRLNYIHNFEHEVGGAQVHNGDGVWVNFTASRELFKDFYFGLNGYWLTQFEGDKINGVEIAGTKQESLYIGPGFHYTLDPKNIINFNVYFSVYDTNAFSDGAIINLQYIHAF